MENEIYSAYKIKNSKIMKTLILCLLATLSTLFSFSQNLSAPNAPDMPQTGKSPSEVFLHADMPPSASIDKTLSYHYRDRESDQCAKARILRSAGFILAAAGSGVLVMGIAMSIAGRNDNDTYNNYYYGTRGGSYYGSNGMGLETAGDMCIGIGAASMAGGITMAVIGSGRVRRLCGAEMRPRYRYRSNMELSTTGNGLALNF